jgi:myxalamid-type polyketide synthase MxaE and MxaD
MLTKPPEDRLLRLLQEARDRLESERRKRTEPIAIVGIGCRFPGGSDGPRALWQLLEQGVDAASRVPRSRWDADGLFDPDPDAPGKSYVRHGGFLGEVDGFDAAFFGISPREARGLDPQQRLLLETTWEALEDAGIAPDGLRGSATGVWVGFSLDDYARKSSGDPHASLGNARSIAAGRIAYVLGIHGPVLQIDTSCSSSLVATHLACQSLRSGECDLALVGGVNLLLSAESTIALCKLRALAPDGRCKTFDAAGDGYGRGEGCGVVVLKRLSDVRQGEERVYAVIRGSAVNHDGRSNGLTAPNGMAQEDVIRKALRNAQIEPSEVDYVEAHGTGTPLGDPIEVMALSRVYSSGRDPGCPLLVGSIKTNIGHLEGAAGIAGLIKAALSVASRRIPPHLHFATPNPRIPWSTIPVRVSSQAQAWPALGRPARAGVSAFGISGTNAHLILEEAQQHEQSASQLRSAELVVVSAQTAPALRSAVARLQTTLVGNDDVRLQDLSRALVATRSSLEHRMAFATTSLEGLRQGLASYADSTFSAAEARPAPTGGKVVFVFPGQGSQWLGMGRELLVEDATFREQVTLCDAAIRAEVGWSVLDELRAEEGESGLSRVDVVQPVLFALQVALARTWQAWGVQPNAVIGHSMGEVAAACVAGALSLADAAAIICRRSRLLRRISGAGAMAVVELSVDEANVAIRGYESRLSIAVSNGVRSTVLSGDPRALTEILGQLTARDVFVRHVKVDVASHSPQVEPLLPELLTELRALRPASAQVAMYSTVSAAKVDGHELDAKYWADNLRQPVQFARVVRELLDTGHALFLEVSPHPLLTSAIDRLREDAGVEGCAVSSLRREHRERQALLDSLGTLFVHGQRLDPFRLFPGPARHVDLPTYPWQRESHWIETAPSTADGGVPSGHPLLGSRLRSPTSGAIYESMLAGNAPSWIADHTVLGQVFFPATAFLELVRAAGTQPTMVQSMSIGAPLVLSAGEGQRIQTVVDATTISVYSQPPSAAIEDAWTLHASAVLGAVAPSSPLPLAEIRLRCATSIDVDQLYNSFASVGLEYGPRFRNVRRLFRGQGEVLAEVALPSDLSDGRYGIHPALLDASLQCAGALVDSSVTQLMLPTLVHDFVLHRAGETLVWVYVHALSATDVATAAFAVRLVTPDGEDVASIGRLEVRAPQQRMSPIAPPAPALYRLAWSPSERRDASATPSVEWAVVALSAAAHGVVDEFSRRGAAVKLVSVDELASGVAGRHVVCLWDALAGGEEAIGQVTRALSVLQVLCRRTDAARVWWVTDGAINVASADLSNPSASAIWGLARTAMQEHPDLPCSLLDAPQRELVDALMAEIAALAPENQVAFRQGRRHVPHLVPLPAALEPPRRNPGRLEGTVLITGGLGGLGFEAAKFFAQQGTAHLLLIGRRGLDAPGAREAVHELTLLGSHVSVAQADVADREAVRTVIRAIAPEHPLKGVVHAAGVLDDGIIAQQNPERLLRVMGPKVLGAWHLHCLTESMALDLFVSFSSLAGTLGSAGQVGYAAANTFLDGLALARRQLGLAGQSIAWGPWSEKGLVASLPRVQVERLRQRGIHPLTVGEGISLFARALALPDANVVAANLSLRDSGERTRNSGPSIGASPRNAGTINDWSRRLATAQEPERAALLRGLVRSAVAGVLHVRDASTLSERRPLRDLGLDSLMGLQLRQRLERNLEARLRVGLAIASLSIHTLTEELMSAWSPAHAEQAAPIHSPAGAAEASVARPPARAAAAKRGEPVADAACLHQLENPRARLFCFHESGGSSSMFLPFVALKEAGLEIHAIEHRRSSRPSSSHGSDYLEDTLDYLARFQDRPQVLFGHSLGAIAAWRVLLELTARAAHPPILLASSAPPVAPDARASRTKVEDVVAALTQRGWLTSENAAAAFRERFNADVELLIAMPPLEFAPVDVPVACFAAQSDTLVPEAQLAAWQGCTHRDFSLTVLPGDHFYLGDDRVRQLFFRELAERIERELAALGQPRALARRITSNRWL